MLKLEAQLFVPNAAKFNSRVAKYFDPYLFFANIYVRRYEIFEGSGKSFINLVFFGHSLGKILQKARNLETIGSWSKLRGEN